MCPISLPVTSENWQRLLRKISRGISLENAAIQCGIPVEEVFSFVSSKLSEIDTLNFELRLVGQNAIKRSLTKLSKLAAGDQRARDTVEYGDDGKPIRSTSFGPDDLEAAKALAKFGMDALKLSKSRSLEDKKTGEQQDLFDRATDPWKLKAVE